MRLRKFFIILVLRKASYFSGYLTKMFYILFLPLMYKLTFPAQLPNNLATFVDENFLLHNHYSFFFQFVCFFLTFQATACKIFMETVRCKKGFLNAD